MFNGFEIVFSACHSGLNPACEYERRQKEEKKKEEAKKAERLSLEDSSFLSKRKTIKA